MKLHFTSDWLCGHIDSDPDIEHDAGFPLRDTVPLMQFVDKESAQIIDKETQSKKPKAAILHVLLHQVRRRDHLSIYQFADLIRVEVTQLENIENDPDFVPRPRTLHKIAEYLNIPTTAVQNLTVDAVNINEAVAEEALRFAASSEDLTALTGTERQGLNSFVKFLSKLDKVK